MADATLVAMHDHDPDSSLHDRITRLEDIAAIHTLKARYAAGSDVCLCTPGHDQAVALAELFTADAFTDYGPFGSFTGRAEIVRAFAEVLPGAATWSRHHVTNPIITVDGREATASFYFILAAVMRGAPGPATLWGGYEDRLVKADDGWRFSQLIVRFAEPPR